MLSTQEVYRCQQPSPRLHCKARTLLGFTDHPRLQPASPSFQPGSFSALLQASDDCLQMPSSEPFQASLEVQEQQQEGNRHRPRKGIKPHAIAASSMVEKIKERMQQYGDCCHPQHQLTSQQHNRQKAVQSTSPMLTSLQPTLGLLPPVTQQKPSREAASNIRHLQKQLWGKARASPPLDPRCHKPQALHQQSSVESIADGTLQEAMQRLDISNIVFKGIPISSRPVAAGPHTPAAPISWPPHPSQQQHSQSPCTCCGSYATLLHIPQGQQQHRQSTSTDQGRLVTSESMSYQHAASSGRPMSHQQPQADFTLHTHTAQPSLQALHCSTGLPASTAPFANAASAGEVIPQGHTSTPAAGVSDPLSQPTALPSSHNLSGCALPLSDQEEQLPYALHSLDGHQVSESLPANNSLCSDLLLRRPVSADLSHHTDTSELQAGGSNHTQDSMPMAARRRASLPTAPVMMIPVSTAPAQTMPVTTLIEEPAACSSEIVDDIDTDVDSSDQATEQAGLEAIIASASGVLASLTAAAAQLSHANNHAKLCLSDLCSTAPVHSQVRLMLCALLPVHAVKQGVQLCTTHPCILVEAFTYILYLASLLLADMFGCKCPKAFQHCRPSSCATMYLQPSSRLP